MEGKVDINSAYKVSDDVVAREIEDELIIVPLVAGIGDMEDELYTLNETGKDIWKRLDGKKSLAEVVKDLADEYEAPTDEIQKDVVGIVGEFLKRRFIIESTG